MVVIGVAVSSSDRAEKIGCTSKRGRKRELKRKKNNSIKLID